MSGAKLGYFVLISVALTMILFIFQTSIDKVGAEIGIETTNQIKGYNYENSNIKQYDKGNFTLDGSIQDTIQSLPTGENDADLNEDGNWFTDTFRSMKEWLLSVTGIKFVLDVLKAVPSFLANIFPGDFKEIGFALGYMWHAITIYALIFWIKGGGN